jgi:hypothetical protein
LLLPGAASRGTGRASRASRASFVELRLQIRELPLAGSYHQLSIRVPIRFSSAWCSGRRLHRLGGICRYPCRRSVRQSSRLARVSGPATSTPDRASTAKRRHCCFGTKVVRAYHSDRDRAARFLISPSNVVLTCRKRRNGAFPLARRGLRGVKLVVSDAHDGINAAVSNAALPSAQPVHGLRNLR